MIIRWFQSDGPILNLHSTHAAASRVENSAQKSIRFSPFSFLAPHSSLFSLNIGDEGRKFYNIDTRSNVSGKPSSQIGAAVGKSGGNVSFKSSFSSPAE